MASPAALRRYRIVLRLLAPVLGAYTLYRALRGGGARYLRQRLGRGIEPRTDRPLWCHCASVGEVRAAAPLLRALVDEQPALAVVVTTVTPAGAEAAGRELPVAGHIYLPLDWPGAVNRLLTAVAPRCGLILETELWPNLFITCREHGIPLVIINARLSKRTAQTKGTVRALYAAILPGVTAVLARGEADRDGFIALGAAADRSVTAGNLKYASGRPNGGLPPDLIGRPYWLAASTHHDEELKLARLGSERDTCGALLVIAPRYPARGLTIARRLRRLNLTVAVRSRAERVTADTQVYVADTLGELAALMTHARLVVMGGSLIPYGGHNILEPARLGRCVVVGPHMENFTEEAEALLHAGALVTIKNTHELRTTLQQLLTNRAQRQDTGQRAKAFIDARAGILQDYLNHLRRLGVIQ